MAQSDLNINLTSSSSNLTIAEFSGELTIDRSNEIYNYLINKLINEDNLSIKISEPISFDLSFIQILVSFLKSRNEKDHKTIVEWNIDELNLELLSKTGIVEAINQLQKQVE